MNTTQLVERLTDASNSKRLDEAMIELVDQLESTGAGLEYMEPILRFMEDHPREDYGSPGPLVHFVERFHRQGYVGELLKSIQRKPTPHTVWMLNRLINGEKDDAEHARLVDVLLHVQENPLADEATRKQASSFYSRINLNMLTLSDIWGPILVAQGETGMGYQIATIVLKNGLQFKQAVIVGSKITKIRGMEQIPFTEKDIEDIIVTHEKWNFSHDG